MSYSDPRVAFRLGALIQSVEDKVIYARLKVGGVSRELEKLSEALEEEDRELIKSWLEYLRDHYSGLDELDPDDRKALLKDLETVRETVESKIR